MSLVPSSSDDASLNAGSLDDQLRENNAASSCEELNDETVEANGKDSSDAKPCESQVIMADTSTEEKHAKTGFSSDAIFRHLGYSDTDDG